jgi:hypothetical protein
VKVHCQFPLVGWNVLLQAGYLVRCVWCGGRYTPVAYLFFIAEGVCERKGLGSAALDCSVHYVLTCLVHRYFQCFYAAVSLF